MNWHEAGYDDYICPHCDMALVRPREMGAPEQCLCGTKMISGEHLKLTADLTADLKAALRPQTGFKAFRGLDGRRRWVAWAASAFEDREGEFFKTKALERYVAEAYRRGDHGKPWFYHLPVVIGDCDFTGLFDKILVKMGTFADNEKGRRAFDYFAAEPDGWGASVGYRYKTEDRRDGAYDWLWIFEVSPVPVERAAFPFSKFDAWEVKAMNLIDDQKTKLQEVFGDSWEELVEEAEKASETLESLGFSFKAVDPIKTLERAVKKLKAAGESVPSELRGALRMLKQDKKAGDEDECEYEYPKPKKGKKMADDHPLSRLAEGTPLGPRERVERGQKAEGGSPIRARYDWRRGEVVPIEDPVTGQKVASSQPHPTLARLGAGTPLAVTRENWIRYEDGQKAPTGVSPLKRKSSPLHLTTEELQEAERRQEEAEAQKAIAAAEARPRERYEHLTCPYCGYSHPIASGGLERTSQKCLHCFRDGMQPTTSPGDTAQARRAAYRPAPGGGGKLTTGI